jgi:RNA polymerase sigma factor for flagellar operon FliA
MARAVHLSDSKTMPTYSASPVPCSVPSVSETNERERDRLILESLPLVRAIARRVYASLPVGVDLEELVSAGMMGLIDAAAKFDGEKQVGFRAYAKHRIKGAILDSLRDLDWASRDLRRRHKQLESITSEFTAVMEREPTEAEIAKEMGMSLVRWRQVAVEQRMAGLVSASTRAPESENQTVLEFPAGNELNPDVLTRQKELRAVLSTAMKTLPERYQAVIGYYYVAGKTMQQIGDRLGINESRVSQIHHRALNQMSVQLQAAGFCSSECLTCI